MQPDGAQQQERTTAAQGSLRALVRLLARSAAQEVVAASSPRSSQEEATDAQSPRRSP